jgi:hypothetical protein
MLLSCLCLAAPLCPADEAVPAALTADDITALSTAEVTAAENAPEVQQGRQALSEAGAAADPAHLDVAVRHFTKAAARGNPVAQTYLGYLYFMGQGVSQNDRMAAAWYHKAAERGFLDAQLRLGLMLKAGRDLKFPERNLARDQAQSLAWLRRAAGQGNLLAFNEIGLYYLQQEGTNGHDLAMQAFRVTAAKDDPIGLAMMCYEDLFGTAMTKLGQSQGKVANTTGTATASDASSPHWCERAKQHPIPGPDEDPAIAYLASDRIPLPR